jgi:hypothetical protein
MVTFQHNAVKFEILKSRYPDMHQRLSILNTMTGKSIGLTVYTPQFKFPLNRIAVKTWGRNASIIDSVFNTEIFEDTGERAANGIVKVEIWELKDQDFSIFRNE